MKQSLLITSVILIALISLTAKSEEIPPIHHGDDYYLTSGGTTPCTMQGQYFVSLEDISAAYLSKCQGFTWSSTGYQRTIESIKKQVSTQLVVYVRIIRESNGSDYGLNSYTGVQYTFNNSYYTCPETHPIHFDVNENGKIDSGDLCSDTPPTCDCTEDLIDGQCAYRDPDYSEGKQETIRGNLHKISNTPNNQGWSCAVLIPDSPCQPGYKGPKNWLANPVNCTNGVKQQSEVDYNAATGQLKLARTYQSTEPLTSLKKRIYSDQLDGDSVKLEFLSNFGKEDKSIHTWNAEGLAYLSLDNSYKGLELATLVFPSGNKVGFVKNSGTQLWERPFLS